MPRTQKPIRVLWHWFTMGPYHFARMEAVARQPGVELLVVETTSMDDHHWVRQNESSQFQLVTLARREKAPEVYRATSAAYMATIEKFKPDIIVESGYGEHFSRETVLAYKSAHPEIRLLIWSESTEYDRKRWYVAELAKRLIIEKFDGALLAGTPHREYMLRLGMPPERTAIIGGCVDNQFFKSSAESLRRQPEIRRQMGLPVNYFLYVGRFIPPKNIRFLLEAYQQYRENVGKQAWELVLVGDGPEMESHRASVTQNEVAGVHFAGSRQISEITAFYAFAGCFVLPSLSEPWGLVVNEAMASGLPVLISDRCGCAKDLIDPGKTGFVFNLSNHQGLVDKLHQISEGKVDLEKVSNAAQQRIRLFAPEAYGEKSVSFFRSILDRGSKSPANGMFGDRLLTKTASLWQSLLEK